MKNAKWLRISGVFALIFFLGITGGSLYYKAEPLLFVESLIRQLSTPVLSEIYHKDLEFVQAKTRIYYRGTANSGDFLSPLDSWKTLTREVPGLQLLYSIPTKRHEEIPFVYENPNADYLKQLRDQYSLAEIVGKTGTEYEKMLGLFSWIGTRWDHGTDPVPGGSQSFKPADVVAAGEAGGKFWCETAARLTVNAATAMGWPARLVTASKDGYNWHHAVAEVWSNQFNKWFVVDSDYNIIYLSEGIPLSAFELCHRGIDLQRRALLQVFRFAPLKTSLNHADLLPFYCYVHIDLRNDWFTRDLAPGSPAGGDLATWWTARPELGPIVTAKIKVDDNSRFDWKVNTVEIYALGTQKGLIGENIQIGLSAYSPYFKHFEYSLDDHHWLQDADGKFRIELRPGRHILKVRVATCNGGYGPTYSFEYQLEM